LIRERHCPARLSAAHRRRVERLRRDLTIVVSAEAYFIWLTYVDCRRTKPSAVWSPLAEC